MNSETNIIFVLPEGLSLGGATTLSVETCRRLIKEGQSAILIEHSMMYGNPKLDFNLSPEIQRINCTHLPHPDNPELDVNDYLPAYRSILPGTIIPNWGYGTFAACARLATTKAGTMRIIGYAHSDEDGYYDWLRYYEPIIHRFIGSTQEIADKLIGFLPHRKEHIIIRPNPVDVPSSLDRGYSSEEKPLQLVHVARVTQRQKKVYDLVDLVQALAEENVNFQLRIIGDGSDKDTLRAKLDTLPAATRQRVTLENSIPLHKLPEVWLASDISILVSEYEGTSLAMLSSMAYGCVPVVTQVSGTEIIEQGINGFCVPVGNMPKMARVIKSLERDRRQLASLGRQAYATIGVERGYEAYTNWLLQVVNEIWQESSRTWPIDRPLLRPNQPVKFSQPMISAPEEPIVPNEVIGNLSGEDIAQFIPIKKIIKAIGFKVAAKPGFRWLYRFRNLGKQLLGG